VNLGLEGLLGNPQTLNLISEVARSTQLPETLTQVNRLPSNSFIC
jgi:hypothetical protein